MREINHNESVRSRFDDIKRDGPNIYTGLLENIDNSIDWGKATNIEIVHNRESITIKDNGPNGFGSIEALERFFTIGKTNEGNITDKTIGKYGKGGYKATISLGNRVEVTTYFDGNEYNYGTNFIEMEEKNNMEPTMKLTCNKNISGEVGSKIKIYLRHEVGLIYNSNEARRHFIRAYHDYGRDINFSLKSDKEILNFNPHNFSPYENFQREKEYFVYYQSEGDQFIYKDNDEGDYVMKINSYVLQDLIKKNPLLSDRKPGIDFYRCRRMCNTRYPIFNIGDVGVNITQGQMRGMRCHITCKFNDTKITELMSMDDYVGVTTVKDIYEDDRMNKSIIKILNEISRETSMMYENLISEQKESFNNYINEISEKIDTMLHMEEDILLKNEYPINEVLRNFENYVMFQTYYFDMDNLVFKFCSSKKEANNYKANKEGTFCTKSNAIYKNIRDDIIPAIKEVIKRKNEIEKKEIEIQIIVKEENITRDEAKIRYKELVTKKISEEKELKRKQELENILNNAEANYKLKNYNEAINLYNEYIEIKDGDCDDISEIIHTIRNEQIEYLKDKMDEYIQDNNFDGAYEVVDMIIYLDNSYLEEMNKKKVEINTHELAYEYSELETMVDEEKYNSSIQKCEYIIERFCLEEKEKEYLIKKIDELKIKELELYNQKVENLKNSNSFKQAKKYCIQMKKINEEMGEKAMNEIEQYEMEYEKRIQKITMKDIDILFKNIVNDCDTDEKVQKLYKVLEYYHNNQ